MKKSAITKKELDEINYYSKKAFKDRKKFNLEFTTIQNRLLETGEPDRYIHTHFPAYWSIVILNLVDSIRRIAPAAVFHTIREEMCGLEVKVDGFDHSRYNEIKTLLLNARRAVDQLVQKRIKDYRESITIS